MSMEVTNNAPAGIVVWEPVFDDDILLAAGAVTYVAGTVLGRITASGKLTHYASGAADGSEVPVAVLLDEEVFTGAGEIPFRPVLAGRLKRADLVAHGVGALTQAEVDALRNYAIIALTTTQLAELDNQ